MLKDFTIANMLDMTQTIAGELFQGKTYSVGSSSGDGDFIVKLGKHWIQMNMTIWRGISGLRNLPRLHLPPALTDQPSSARIQKCATVHLSAAKLL